MRLPSLAQVKRAADAARDWAAVLYTPVLTVYAVWLTAAVAFFPWSQASEAQRLNILGGALVAALCLIGLGTLFYQRRPAPSIRAKGPAGELEILTDGQRAMERPAPEGRGERATRALGLAPEGSSGPPVEPGRTPQGSR